MDTLSQNLNLIFPAVFVLAAYCAYALGRRAYFGRGEIIEEREFKSSRQARAIHADCKVGEIKLS